MFHLRRPVPSPMSSCIDSVFVRLRAEDGQATVEGAFLIPLIFLLLLLLLQPGVLLYDRMVMSSAAAEGCRMLATRSSASGIDASGYREAILRHLGAIPQQECFHRHQDGCSWEIEFTGDEHSPQVGVRITGSVKLLPLLDVGGTLLGLGDGKGNIEVSVSTSMPTQDDWVPSNGLGMNPASWVGRWK